MGARRPGIGVYGVESLGTSTAKTIKTARDLQPELSRSKAPQGPSEVPLWSWSSADRLRAPSCSRAAVAFSVQLIGGAWACLQRLAGTGKLKT